MRLSQRAQSLNASATLAMTAKAREMRAAGIDVISFAAGEPDFTTPVQIREAAKQALDQGLTSYTPTAGLPELREAVREKLRRDNQLTYAPDEVTVTCGAKHAIYNALQILLDPGDEVLIPAPYWVSYPDQVELAGGIPVIIPCPEASGFKLQPADLQKAITEHTRAIILNYPSNPTGSTYTREELAALAKVLCAEGIAIISDEIYEKLLYTEMPHTSIAQLSDASRATTLVINGVSKSYAMTGWRMGFAAGPKEVIAKMSSLTGQQISGIPAFVQQGCIEALLHAETEVTAMREAFRRRRDLMLERLTAIPGVSCHVPDGAFYLLPNISQFIGRSKQGTRIENADQLAAYLLEEAHIAVVSGIPFGAHGHIRLSYATSEEAIEKGMERLQKALSALA